MCGCDYNTNIPKIGVETSYKHILKYRTIEEFEKQRQIPVTNEVDCSTDSSSFSFGWLFLDSLMCLSFQRIGDTMGEPLSQLPLHLADDDLPCLSEDGFARRLVGVGKVV